PPGWHRPRQPLYLHHGAGHGRAHPVGGGRRDLECDALPVRPAPPGGGRGGGGRGGGAARRQGGSVGRPGGGGGFGSQRRAVPGGSTARRRPRPHAVIDPTDLRHLERCIELATEALAAGDEPFGSVLVDGDGRVRFEDRNRVAGGDRTQHPEFAIARWAAAHMSPPERAVATVYTSGEHCPMCAAAHGWVGLGRIV